MNLAKVRHFHLTFVKECNNLIWFIKYTWVRSLRGQISPELCFIRHSVNVNWIFWLCVLDTEYRLGLLLIYFGHHLNEFWKTVQNTTDWFWVGVKSKFVITRSWIYITSDAPIDNMAYSGCCDDAARPGAARPRKVIFLLWVLPICP